ncbi:MAG TPA: cbb3-type cytochrome c oxidase subunit II [Nocardioidaceae bacterium]|nr:cbb3-type cytochrome c oxidase subunit II [Nocardioidaceae bacterium]
MTDHSNPPSPAAPEASEKAVNPQSDHEPRWMRFLERGETIMLLGGLGSLVFSFLALGVIPLIELRDEVTASTPASFTAMNAEEERGFRVYKQEGCAYCHTTFVRDTPSDVRRFGPPAEAWEYQDQYPQQWGTRRIGPDLSRESGKRSDGWQYAHLFNPRSTVPQSVMPSYPWLFSEMPDGSVVPNQDAEALVSYLNYLGRDIKESGPQTERGKNAMHGSAGSSHGGM